MEHTYRISVIIPVHNSEKYINESLTSLLKQTMPQKDFEVLLVNNGSTDSSEEICNNFSTAHPNFKSFTIEEKGVSFARNAGINAAKGKYLLYLDADDTVTPNTLLSVANFFDKHYDETDMVTYKIVPYKNGRRCKPHDRYNILRKTGVYDLEKENNCYTVQTTINVCVKNLCANNFLFNTNLAIHEDQNYNVCVLNAKKTIGFVKGPEYHYIRHNDSATGFKENAYYNFEHSTSLWENLLKTYTNTVSPRYLQAFVLHDINWKTSADILLPYHYEDNNYRIAINRITALVKSISDDVILGHPTASDDFKLFLLKLKHGKDNFSLDYSKGIKVLLDNRIIYESKEIAINIQRVKSFGKMLNIDFCVQHPALFFLKSPMHIYITVNGKRTELNYCTDDYNFFTNCEVSAPYIFGRTQIDLSYNENFFFEVDFDGHLCKADCKFQVDVPLKNQKIVNGFFADNIYISYHKNNSIFICKKYDFFGKLLRKSILSVSNALYFGKQNPRVPVLRFLYNLKIRKNIWFYQDIAGVFDNAYLQFMHDIKINDGITRYYIIHGEDLDKKKMLFSDIPEDNFIIYGSRKHKIYYFSAKKIITGYSNLSNICPYDAYPYRWYSDLTQYELIYLQHGVLHASLEKMYAHKNCQIDKVVVSTTFEIKNFTSDKYGYREDELITSCMPRYDFIDATNHNPPKKILFAPSWRINLVGKLVIDKREAFDDLFVHSSFYTKVMDTLNSSELAELLQKYDLTLDIKLHPNFSCYEKFFKFDNDRISLLKDNFHIEDYAVMITDYSSMVFDAVYLNCPVLYFVPDYDQFKSGISSAYRKLDLPLENGFGPFAETGEQLIENLKLYAENGFIPPQIYAERMDNLFLHKDNNACTRLYHALTNE